MYLSPSEFIELIKEGKTIKELNKKETTEYSRIEFNKLLTYGHTRESAKEHLLTDYSNGFTICKKCGSFYQLGKGFTKHISNGCLHCEGEEKHRVYYVNASEPRYGGFPARYMSQMFDDGMSYCKDKLEIEKYKSEVETLN